MGWGKLHATNVIEWQQKAAIYYRNWQERLKNVPDNQLAECTQQSTTGKIATVPSTASTVLLSSVFVGMYNDALQPNLDQQSDSSGAADARFEAGAVTPREVLDNVRINATLCGEDRKRLDELINHLLDVGAMH